MKPFPSKNKHTRIQEFLTFSKKVIFLYAALGVEMRKIFYLLYFSVINRLRQKLTLKCLNTWGYFSKGKKKETCVLK